MPLVFVDRVCFCCSFPRPPHLVLSRPSLSAVYCETRHTVTAADTKAFTAARRTEILAVNTEVSSVTLSLGRAFCHLVGAVAAAGPAGRRVVRLVAFSLCRPLILFRVTVSQVRTNDKHLNHDGRRYTAPGLTFK